MLSAPGTELGDGLKELIQYAELRHLAQSIALLQREKAFRSLAVLSVLPSEGKTLLCASLAMAYAEQISSDVLVIDAGTVLNSRSLSLKDCLDPLPPHIDFRSLEEIRQNGGAATLAEGNGQEEQQEYLPSVVSERTLIPPRQSENDSALIQNAVEQNGKSYGLILVDTVPLTAKNRKNFDPYLVARTAEASILLVSPRLLNNSDLRKHLKALEDPTLHLIGVVANEEFGQ